MKNKRNLETLEGLQLGTVETYKICKDDDVHIDIKLPTKETMYITLSLKDLIQIGTQKGSYEILPDND